MNFAKTLNLCLSVLKLQLQLQNLFNEKTCQIIRSYLLVWLILQILGKCFFLFLCKFIWFVSVIFMYFIYTFYFNYIYIYIYIFLYILNDV